MEEEVFDVYVDEDGNEFIMVDGKRVPLDEDEFDVVEVDDDGESEGTDSADFNPLAYDNVQAATDVANDFAREGASIAREGAALVSEMKEAMDDISSMFDFKSWLK